MNNNINILINFEVVIFQFTPKVLVKKIIWAPGYLEK